MPELPEVECTVLKIRSQVCKQKILKFRASWPRQISPSIANVRRGIVGKRIERLSRRGKYLVFHLDRGGFFLVHLGMTGRLEISQPGTPRPAHVRAEWDLRQHQLLFCDARKFGRIQHCADLSFLEARLGLEPLDPSFTVPRLTRTLQAYSKQLKPLLLEQKAVAGLGNIYVDESLYRARIHPLAHSDQLTHAAIRRLHGAIRQVLKEAIRLCGTSFDWAYPGGRMQTRLKVYGRKHLPCKRCHTPIQVMQVVQRTTHYCPQCQSPKGRSST